LFNIDGRSVWFETKLTIDLSAAAGDLFTNLLLLGQNDATISKKTMDRFKQTVHYFMYTAIFPFIGILTEIEIQIFKNG